MKFAKWDEGNQNKRGVRWHIYIPWESVPDFIIGEQDLDIV
jgi:hypothetical protein